MRLFLPGYEGNMNVKWLRRIKVTAEPTMTKDETSKYSDLQSRRPLEAVHVPDGSEVGDHVAVGHAEDARARVSIKSPASRGRASAAFGASKSPRTAARAGRRPRSTEPVLPKAVTRFRMPWRWDGSPSVLQSRAIDETGAVQPTRAALIAARGAQLPLPLQRDSELERYGRRERSAMSTS